MSPFKSSNSLQNSIYSFSFCKLGRFDGLYKKPHTDNIYNIPEKKNMRFTSQGFGKRYDLIGLNGKYTPPPNSYNLKSCFERNIEDKKGPLILEKFSQIVKKIYKKLKII